MQIYFQISLNLLLLLFFSIQEEKWYSTALKEEVDKITKEKVELEQKCSSLEKVLYRLLKQYKTYREPVSCLVTPFTRLI